MAAPRTSIPFTVYYEGGKHELQTYEGEYRNLMVLLYDKIYIDGFGDCKGMGRCGTCAVKIEHLPAEVNILYRNEEQTLSKMGIHGGNVRLSCQILVDKNLRETVVQIVGADSVEDI